MSRILYFDCFSGAAGDMLLGALLDAGVPFEELRAALGSLAIAEAQVSAEKVTRAAVGATKFSVREQHASSHEHSHAHHHHHHHHSDGATAAVAHPHTHRTLKEINAL